MACSTYLTLAIHRTIDQDALAADRFDGSGSWGR
jgi:hypothetical protein